MLLPYTKEQKERMKIVVADASRVADGAVKLNTKITEGKDPSGRLTEHFKNTMIYISRTNPNAKKCHWEISRLQTIYEDYLNWHNEIIVEIKELSPLIDRVNRQMKEFQN